MSQNATLCLDGQMKTNDFRMIPYTPSLHEHCWTVTTLCILPAISVCQAETDVTIGEINPNNTVENVL